MIREIALDFIALVAFSVGGALSAYPLLFLKPFGKRVSFILDFLLGILPFVTFIILTEVYFESVITHFTPPCFLAGYILTLLLFKERKVIKKSAFCVRSKNK